MKRNHSGFSLVVLLIVMLLAAALALYSMRVLNSGHADGAGPQVHSSEAVEQARQAVDALNQRTEETETH